MYNVLDFRVQRGTGIVFMKRNIKTEFERERRTFQMLCGVQHTAVAQNSDEYYIRRDIINN